MNQNPEKISKMKDNKIKKILYDQFADCVQLITIEESVRYMAKINLERMKRRIEHMIDNG